MKISIIIPSYNCSAYLPEAIESALQQSRPPDEIVVVDDGSTDGTEAVLGPLPPGVTYLRQSNSGVSRARNRGAEASTGDHLLFLDADDRLAPGALERLEDALRRHAGEAVVFGAVQPFDERGHCGRVLTGAALEGSPPHSVRALFWSGSIPPSAFLVPRSCFDRAGRFDQRFAPAADLDLWLRCACRATFVRVADVVLYYRQHSSMMSHRLDEVVGELLEVRYRFIEWLRAEGLEVQLNLGTSNDILDHFLTYYYFRRTWNVVDLLLAQARRRGQSSATTRRIARMRRVPRPIFAIKDRVDEAIGRLNWVAGTCEEAGR